MEEKIRKLEKRVADLEVENQNQQQEFEEAIAFLFNKSYYKELIREGIAEWPAALSRALKKINY